MMPHHVRTQAVVFDWDNTLVDTWPVLTEAVNATLSHMGHRPWTREEVRIRTARSMKDYFPELFGDRWEEAGRFFHRTFLDHHLRLLKPLPNVVTMLKRLKEEGVYLAVVSNKIPEILKIEAEALGWHDLFGRVVGSGVAEHDKPAPEPLYHALHGSGIEAGPSVWFVGDAVVDILCGKNAGCRTALVALEKPQGTTLASNPDFVFSHYADLIEHLFATKRFL